MITFRGIEIDFMKDEDIPAVQEIEKVSFSSPWPDNSFDNELHHNRVACYLVAKYEGKVIGYCGGWIIMDEVHITSVAVKPEFRGKKIGEQLIWQLLSVSLEKGARWSTLEVREGNDAAIKLYEKFGFVKVGTRKAYYDYRDNAIVMWAGNLQGEGFRKKIEEIEKDFLTPPEKES
ncbi:MAG: ribosomal protein S18-alanine N-acetyltransferase [Firmicutes bacterium]|nr:ribosomal protein S18-alanine N-acetyltransferase [Bacillota bacterium]